MSLYLRKSAGKHTGRRLCCHRSVCEKCCTSTFAKIFTKNLNREECLIQLSYSKMKINTKYEAEICEINCFSEKRSYNPLNFYSIL